MIRFVINHDLRDIYLRGSHRSLNCFVFEIALMFLFLAAFQLLLQVLDELVYRLEVTDFLNEFVIQFTQVLALDVMQYDIEFRHFARKRFDMVVLWEG